MQCCNLTGKKISEIKGDFMENRLRGDKVDGSRNYELEADEECLDLPVDMKKDPRNIYCHMKGCKKLARFGLIPGGQGLCEDHEPGRWMRKHCPGNLFIPDDYWQWKDEEEWRALGG